MAHAALLETRNVAKSYGAVQALRGIDLCIARGQTLALVGDNGAGKSTLVKILSGVLRPTSGTILHDGAPVDLASTADARRLGIETVYQDLGLCQNLSVADNVFLGRERTRGIGPFRLLHKRAMRDATAAALDGLAVNVPHPDAGVVRLSGGQRQAVALARAKLWEQSLVILDEPTAALGVQETQRAMAALRDMQARGTAVLLITHNMPTVMDMSHRVVVLRHGRKVGDVATAALAGPDDVVALITGARAERIEVA